MAEDEGGEVLDGGTTPDDPALAGGCYVLPTVVRADPAARVCREEVFGPFVTVTTFAGDDEAVAVANSTDYGLGAGLWTRDLSRAHRAGPGVPGRDGVGQLLQASRARARRSAASASPATAGRWASRPCAATPTPSRCG